MHKLLLIFSFYRKHLYLYFIHDFSVNWGGNLYPNIYFNFKLTSIAEFKIIMIIFK